MALSCVAATRADRLGHCVIAGKVHIHDLHATMLHLPGLDTPSSPGTISAETSA
jgi:hypothetical protein